MTRRTHETEETRSQFFYVIFIEFEWYKSITKIMRLIFYSSVQLFILTSKRSMQIYADREKTMIPEFRQHTKCNEIERRTSLAFVELALSISMLSSNYCEMIWWIRMFVVVWNAVSGDVFLSNKWMASPESACVRSGVLLFGVSWPFVKSTAKNILNEY